LIAINGIIVCQKRFWMEMIYQPTIYFSVVKEKDGLCFYDLNTPKLNRVQKISILTTGVCFKFLWIVVFNYNKNLKLFDSKSLLFLTLLSEPITTIYYSIQNTCEEYYKHMIIIFVHKYVYSYIIFSSVKKCCNVSQIKNIANLNKSILISKTLFNIQLLLYCRMLSAR